LQEAGSWKMKLVLVEEINKKCELKRLEAAQARGSVCEVPAYVCVCVVMWYQQTDRLVRFLSPSPCYCSPTL
jgi:hypothetical protein